MNTASTGDLEVSGLRIECPLPNMACVLGSPGSPCTLTFRRCVFGRCGGIRVEAGCTVEFFDCDFAHFAPAGVDDGGGALFVCLSPSARGLLLGGGNSFAPRARKRGESAGRVPEVYEDGGSWVVALDRVEADTVLTTARSAAPEKGVDP